MHHPTTSSSTPRPRCPFFFRGILNPRSEDVDLYICEHCGQLLVSVGECAVRIAGYGLLKLLRSRCFATIELSPYFAKQPNVSRNANSVTTPSRAAVRAATSDFPLVTFPSLMRTERVRARASTDGAFRFPTGVYSTAPSVQNRLYMHAFAPPERETACDHRDSTLRIHNSCVPRI